MFKKIFISLSALILNMAIPTFVLGMESILGSDNSYLEMCKKAGTNSFYFHFFRSFPEYTHALELTIGDPFAEYVAQSTLLQRLEEFRELDSLGNPTVRDYPSIGSFSATTLRYMVIADHIHQLFDLPKHPKIVEIGAGFGGQCFVLSKFYDWEKYYIYDLPVVSQLIAKVMNHFSVPNVELLPIGENLPEEKADLFISNYAFSEMARETQLEYFYRVLVHVDRGYVIYNQISKSVFGIDSLTPREFYKLLEQNNMNPSIQEEPISTHPDNLLVLWNRKN